MFNKLRSGIRSLFTRSDVERDLDDEIRDHLDRDIADRVQHGVAPREARRQALADFGGVDNVRERLRDEHGISIVEDLARDTRFAMRRLGRNPRYATLIVLTIGLGIGAATAVFSAVDGVLFKPLSLENPDAIVTLWQTKLTQNIDHALNLDVLFSEISLVTGIAITPGSDDYVFSNPLRPGEFPACPAVRH